QGKSNLLFSTADLFHGRIASFLRKRRAENSSLAWSCLMGRDQHSNFRFWHEAEVRPRQGLL
ncbi:MULTISPECIES: hypothetical protein, partial [unclassified Brenneria]|uniref:hypothetical protein n=1 Tax=unclassified Brenneria TaxID=2634434 RepID=UPI001F1F9F3C